MVKLHLADGSTEAVDLQDEEQARPWLEKLGRADFQALLRGVTLISKQGGRGLQYSVPRPDGMKSIRFDVEAFSEGRGGERIVLLADDTRLILTAHAQNPSCRVTLGRISRRVGGFRRSG